MALLGPIGRIDALLVGHVGHSRAADLGGLLGGSHAQGGRPGARGTTSPEGVQFGLLGGDAGRLALPCAFELGFSGAVAGVIG